jgi:hypothetical protein
MRIATTIQQLIAELIKTMDSLFSPPVPPEIPIPQLRAQPGRGRGNPRSNPDKGKAASRTSKNDDVTMVLRGLDHFDFNLPLTASTSKNQPCSYKQTSLDSYSFNARDPISMIGVSKKLAGFGIAPKNPSTSNIDTSLYLWPCALFPILNDATVSINFLFPEVSQVSK